MRQCQPCIKFTNLISENQIGNKILNFRFANMTEGMTEGMFSLMKSRTRIVIQFLLIRFLKSVNLIEKVNVSVI